MVRFRAFIAIICLLMIAGIERGWSTEIQIAASSDLQIVMPELVRRFEAETQHQAKVIYGAAGDLTRRIVRGDRYDVLLSDSPIYIDLLVARKLTLEAGRKFATGELVLFVGANSGLVTDSSLDDLATAAARGDLNQLAISAPDKNGYGLAARRLLESRDLWLPLLAKIRNTAHAAAALQLVLDGEAEAAIVPFHLVNDRQALPYGTAISIAPISAGRIEHAMVLLHGSGSAALEWADFLRAESAQAILQRAGLGGAPLAAQD